MTADGSTDTAAKPHLREVARQRRDALSAPARAAACAEIARRCCAAAPFRAAATVFVYLATAAEVQTRALIERCQRDGKTVVVPRICSKTEMRAVDFPGWDALSPGTLGILRPDSTRPTRHPIDLVIVPGLAFADDGTRLGYGGGYYDRWLAAHPQVVTVALAFEVQRFAALPRTATDVPVQHLITEKRHLTLEIGSSDKLRD